MTFGPNGFFGYTPYTTGDVKAEREHILGEATLPAGKMSFWWSRSAQKDPDANPDENALRQELEKRIESWKDPAIHKIVENSDLVLKIPTWVLPKIPTWAGKRVVLVGDAAHGKLPHQPVSVGSLLISSSVAIFVRSRCFSVL